MALFTAGAWLLLVVVLEWRNPRLIPSWHGFLHSAIVTRFPSATLVPENPFFAGEPLPYYWLYHWIGAQLAWLLGLSPLAALQWFGLGSLAVVVTLSVDVGRRLTGSSAAGVLVGFLALAGANPFGPLVAASKLAVSQQPLWDAPRSTSIETVFVDNREADELMSQPLLAALYFGMDWRNGQNLVWFWDVSSRGPALAVLMFLIWSLVRGGRTVELVLAMSVLTGLNPLMGLGVAISLGSGMLVVERTNLVLESVGPFPGTFRKVGALTAGVVLASPAFFHLFQYRGAGGLSAGGIILTKAVYLALNFGVVSVLALLASRRAPVRERAVLTCATVAGLVLIALTIALRLAEGNEHNLVNAAAVLFAVPAGVLAWYVNSASHVRAARLALVIGLLHVPMTAATILAFDGRPGIPLRYFWRLERLPSDHPVAVLERWIQRETASESILVSDPDRPIKMSGNVSELPALTGRTLFIDQASYLTRPYADFARRVEMARAMLAGRPLPVSDLDYLRHLGRPIYIVATQPTGLADLEALYGSPLFASDLVAVFRLVP